MSDFKPGDVLVVTMDTDCLSWGELVTVEINKGELFVQCKKGRHYLSHDEPLFRYADGDDHDRESSK